MPLCGSVRETFRARKRTYLLLRGSSSILSKELRSDADVKLKTAIEYSRKQYEAFIAYNCRHNTKLFWGHVRAAYASKPLVTAVMGPDGLLSQNSQQTADILNNHFVSAFN